jgi:co-chaperonin GroES (HSP10)
MVSIKYIKLVLFCIIVASVVVLASYVCNAQEQTIASKVLITGIAGEGDVKVLKAGTTNWIDAQENMELSEGDRIMTGDNSGASIKYEDGAIVDIIMGANIVVAQLRDVNNPDKTQNIFNYESGYMHGLFEKIPAGEESRFEIRTSTAVCGVLGTKIYIDDKSGTVYVVDGALTIINMITGDEYIVEAGSSVQINPDGTVTGPQPYSQEELDKIIALFDIMGIDVLGYSPPVGGGPGDPGAFTLELEQPASTI